MSSRALAAALTVGLAACGGRSTENPILGGSPPPLQEPPRLDGLPPLDAPAPLGGAFAFPPLQATVETIELHVPEATLALFAADPYTPEQAAEATYGGVRRPVLVRLRGGSSRSYPKKSWHVETTGVDRIDGRRKLNLVAEMADRTVLVEKLALDLLLAMGAPAPRTRWIRLLLNGRYEGLYLDIEAVNRDFVVAHRFDDSDATVYRCGTQDCELKPFRWDYQGPWEKKTNEREPWDDLEALLDLVNRTPEPRFAEVLATRLDVERYLRSMAMDALASNDIVMDSGSYLVADRVTGRWTYVPWDLNNSAARWWPTYGLGSEPIVTRPVPVFAVWDPRVQVFFDRRNPGGGVPYYPAFSNLTTRVFQQPAFRERLADIVEKALGDLFAPEVIEPRLEAMHALVAPWVEQDPYVNLTTDGTSDPDGLAKFHASLAYLKAYARGRAAFLRAELPRWRAWRPALVLSSFDPASGQVEIANRGVAPVSTAGLVLTDDLRRSAAANLPALTIAPGATARFGPEDHGLAFGAAGEVGLFDGRTANGAHDLLFYGPLEAGRVYARAPDADGTWVVR